MLDLHVEWMYVPTDRRAVSMALETIYSANTIYNGIHRISPHRLATVLLVFALGTTFSANPCAASSSYYFSSASALLTLSNTHFLVRHSLAAIECLHMMVSYLFTTGDSTAAKAAWPVLGICVRLACGMGLHRDSGTWGLAGRDKAERERLWWEIVTYDML